MRNTMLRHGNCNPHIDAWDHVLVGDLLKYSPAAVRICAAENNIRVQQLTCSACLNNIALNARYIRILGEGAYGPCRNFDFGKPYVAGHCVSKAVQISVFQNVWIDEDEISNTEMRDLLCHN